MFQAQRIMKRLTAHCFLTITLMTTSRVSAVIVAGPITNPKNGHDYYLLAPNVWTVSEAEAEQLGGTLAVIKNAGEQEWVLSTFGSYGATNRNLWIGLRRYSPGGPFVWVTDNKVDYLNWQHGQPDNNGGNENYVHMFSNAENRTPGAWNDFAEGNSFDGAPICGVVEVPGKSNEKSLTEQEKALVGTWYCNGDPDQPCWIAGTDNLFFAIDQGKDASRLIYTAEGSLFSAKWKQHAEIVKDKLLWSRGNWWSRKPAEYKSENTSNK